MAPLRAVVRLAAPTTVVMAVAAVSNIVYTYFVSRLGVEAIGAVSLVFPVSLLAITAMGGGIGAGADPAAHRRDREERDREDERHGADRLHPEPADEVGVDDVGDRRDGHDDRRRRGEPHDGGERRHRQEMIGLGASGAGRLHVAVMRAGPVARGADPTRASGRDE